MSRDLRVPCEARRRLRAALDAAATTLEELREAVPWLEWAQAHALPSGVLAEQIDPYSGAPLSVSPLTWSHAEYVAAVRWYAGKYAHLLVERAHRSFISGEQ